MNSPRHNPDHNNEVVLFERMEDLNEVLAERNILQISYEGKRYNMTKVQNRIFVFEAYCPHFDYPLSEAKVNVNAEVICAWHNYKFNLLTGKESQGRSKNLYTREAKQNADGQVVVKF